MIKKNIQVLKYDRRFRLTVKLLIVFVVSRVVVYFCTKSNLTFLNGFADGAYIRCFIHISDKYLDDGLMRRQPF